MSSISAYSSDCGVTSSAPARKSLFQRLLDRFIESRMRKAEEILRQHVHLIPRELEDRITWKISRRSEDSLPFIR